MGTLFNQSERSYFDVKEDSLLAECELVKNVAKKSGLKISEVIATVIESEG